MNLEPSQFDRVPCCPQCGAAVVAVFDWETRAARDLKKTGVEAYVECPLFRASCMSWAFACTACPWDGPIYGWDLLTGGMDRIVSTNLISHVAAGKTFVAHNARFELAVWRKLRERDPDIWPELRVDTIVDTMALARAMALPGALGDLAPALRLPIKKDHEGHKLMLKLCKPRPQRKKADKGRIEWNEEPADLARQLDYCKWDTAVERLVWRKLPMLSPDEYQTWVADQEINDNGIYIDETAVRNALAAVAVEKERLNTELLLLTDGYVRTAGAAKVLQAWLASWDCVLPNLQKSTVAEALGRTDLHPTTRRVLEIRQECAKASTAKLNAMIHGLCADGRMHGLLEYHGAATGRWAGRRIQPQNMPRTPDTFGPEQAEDVFAWLALQ